MVDDRMVLSLFEEESLWRSTYASSLDFIFSLSLYLSLLPCGSRLSDNMSKIYEPLQRGIEASVTNTNRSTETLHE